MFDKVPHYPQREPFCNVVYYQQLSVAPHQVSLFANVLSKIAKVSGAFKTPGVIGVIVELHYKLTFPKMVKIIMKKTYKP